MTVEYFFNYIQKHKPEVTAVYGVLKGHLKRHVLRVVLVDTNIYSGEGQKKLHRVRTVNNVLLKHM